MAHQAETDMVPQPNVSIIPPMELPNLQRVLVELEQEAVPLARWRDSAKSIEIKDATTYAEAGQLLAQVRSFKKIPGFKLGEYLAKARRVVDWLRTEENRHVNAAEEIDGILKGKMAEYKRKETAAAAEEERRINEERRKVAEEKAEADRKTREKEIKQQQKSGEVSKREADKLRKEADQQAESDKNNIAEVKVKPSVPTVSGVRMTTNWKFSILDARKIPRQFLCPDLVAIGSEVRRIKNKEQAEKRIPGVTVWSE